jgi:hypothetical protein
MAALQTDSKCSNTVCMLRFRIGLRSRVGGITHLIVLIKVCLLPLNVIYYF